MDRKKRRGYWPAVIDQNALQNPTLYAVSISPVLTAQLFVKQTQFPDSINLQSKKLIYEIRIDELGIMRVQFSTEFRIFMKQGFKDNDSP
jgi:hypothetical protein